MNSHTPPHSPETGTVYLVGAGPGDPELLTLKAARLIDTADIIVYDNLVSTEIMGRCPKTTQIVYAGKKSGNHSIPQEELNLLLVKLAREHKSVVRLKGGDPYTFGRGGEEAQILAQHGVAFEIVPGITAATGVAAYAGIPLTHRDYAQSCVFVTGHLKDGSMNLDWPGLARTQQTVVIYMGLGGLEVLCQKFIAHGLPENWPAAIVQHGTRCTQKTLTGTLATLPALAIAARLRAPTLVIVGQVVKLHDQLDWFEKMLPPADTR